MPEKSCLGLRLQGVWEPQTLPKQRPASAAIRAVEPVLAGARMHRSVPSNLGHPKALNPKTQNPETL